MKNSLTIPILLLAIGAFGQTKQPIRYFKYSTYFTLEGGCIASSIGTIKMIKGSLDYDIIKRSTVKWIYPDKLKKFEVYSIKEITRAEMLNHSEKFKCDTVSYITFTKGTLTLDTTKIYQNVIK